MIIGRVDDLLSPIAPLEFGRRDGSFCRLNILVDTGFDWGLLLKRSQVAEHTLYAEPTWHPRLQGVHTVRLIWTGNLYEAPAILGDEHVFSGQIVHGFAARLSHHG